MMYLIAQTWLFLAIAWLIGIVVGFALSRDQKSQRHAQVEEELRDARNRSIDMDKEIEEYRSRVAELEGLPQGARASRVAAREEVLARMSQVERELDLSRTNEKRLADEVERLRNDVDGFRTRYLEARAKWDEFQAKAEALAAAPQPLTLGEAQIVGADDGMRERVLELEVMLAEATKARERATARVSDLEARTAGGGQGSGRAGEQNKALQVRIAELEARLGAGIVAARENDALKSRVADLQDKLGEAEVALRKSIGATKQEAEPLRARISELEAQLAARTAAATEGVSLKSMAEASALRTRLAELETKLSDAQRQASEAQSLRARLADAEKSARSTAEDGETRRLQARNVDLEQALERARRQAAEAQSLRAQVTSLEARLDAAETGRGAAQTDEDVQLLKARLADVESRLMASSSSPVEFESLRNRVMTLEALLHEAAKSRDEAAILRSKVAELDGRLGQAMKDAARARAGEKV